MENAAKALLIAAGVLVGIIVISLIMVGYREISVYYTAKEEAKEFQQLDAFNKQYIPYNRDDVRGSDLLSLINKIVDFNTINSDEESIEISIIIPKNSKGFYYEYNKEENPNVTFKKLIDTDKRTTYTADPADKNNINGLISMANNIEKDYTQAMATKLSASISTLFYGGNSLKQPEDLLKELKINKDKFGGLVKIQEDILQYYQYQQFKRAHFNCTSFTFNDDGRVESFEFKFTGKFE